MKTIIKLMKGCYCLIIEVDASKNLKIGKLSLNKKGFGFEN